MKRGPEHYVEAYKSLLHLRGLPLLAAKELFYVHCQIEIERRLLSQRSHDAERHLSDHQGPKKTYHKNSQAVRKRKRSHGDDAWKASFELHEKRVDNSNGGPASEHESKEVEDNTVTPRNRKSLPKTTKNPREMWQLLMAPKSRSINYWQKLGQLLTERRIRRVFQTALPPSSYTNHGIGNHLSRSVYDITTALWCECISIL